MWYNTVGDVVLKLCESCIACLSRMNVIKMTQAAVCRLIVIFNNYNISDKNRPCLCVESDGSFQFVQGDSLLKSHKNK